MSMDQAIREHYPMPEDVRERALAANSNLHFGPEGAEYPFAESLTKFVDWLDGLDLVWWDDDAGMVVTALPECVSGGLEEMHWEIDAKAIARAYGFGALYMHR